MPSYPDLTGIAQTGGDLNRLSGSGSAEPTPPWDPQLDGECSGTPLVDFCFHGDELWAAWVEVYDDSGTLRPRGPFVSRLVGGVWTAVGGELETLTAVPFIDAHGHPPYYNISVEAINSRFYPGRVHIASDGTNVYVAYSIHVTRANPYSPGNNWDARRCVVQQWDGASWSVIYEPDATLNNCVGWNSDGTGGGTAKGGFWLHDLGASPGEVGVCYVAYTEFGPHGTSGSGYVRQVTTRIASGTPTERVIIDADTGTDDPDIGLYENVSMYIVSGVDLGNGGNIVFRNETGTCWLFAAWQQNNGSPFDVTITTRMRNYATDTDAQTWTAASPYTYGSPTFPAGHQHVSYAAARNVYYVTGTDPATGHPILCQIPDDGSAKQVPIDDPAPPIFATNGGHYFGVGRPIPVEPDDVWGLFGYFSSFSTLNGKTWLYHRNCRGLDLIGMSFDGITVGGVTSVPVTMLALYDAQFVYLNETDGAKVYIAGVWNDDAGAFNRVRVFEQTIEADAHSCSDPVAVFARARYTIPLS